MTQTKPGPEHVLGPDNERDVTPTSSRKQGGPARPPRPDPFARLQGAFPLLVVYFLFATLYAWQASRRPVPTIFTDELELGQLSRSIAATGEAARRGQPYELWSLLPYVLAPVWWLATTTAAYATAKYLLVLMMTATVFPAYGLARLVVPRWYALAAATASIAVPAMAYSPIFVKEPLAYPLSTLCSSPRVVTMMTGISRVSSCSRIRRQASKPSIRGMTTSMRMRSGRSDIAFSSPSCPSRAVTTS